VPHVTGNNWTPEVTCGAAPELKTAELAAYRAGNDKAAVVAATSTSSSSIGASNIAPFDAASGAAPSPLKGGGRARARRNGGGGGGNGGGSNGGGGGVDEWANAVSPSLASQVSRAAAATNSLMTPTKPSSIKIVSSPASPSTLRHLGEMPLPVTPTEAMADIRAILDLDVAF
jgi:hypothetical protein